MHTEDTTLNTESNDIAGNPIDGPAGNTASKPGPAVGQPSSAGNYPVPAAGGPVPPAPEPAAAPAAPSAAPAGQQPDAYGGNFSNSTQNVANDSARHDNQASSADRGEFGVQGALGTTHGGFGNQFREGITEHQGDAEAKYYGDGNVRPGAGDHNAYRDYDGHDQRPDVLPSPAERTVADTAAMPPASAAQATDGRGNEVDNRNLPDRTDAAAAFQNDNGSAEVAGAGYASDYGHTSGVGLPRTAGQPQETPAAPGRNQAEDQRSSRGGYDNQGSAGGEHRGTAAPAGQQPAGAAPAPAGPDAPHAPQGEGYGYGHQRSEQPKPADNDTGAARQGSTPGTQLASHGGDTSQGYGSKGGSYDDQNPGAHPGGLDQHTSQAQNAQQKPASQGDDTEAGNIPRRNAARDDEQAAE
jgi:hypothetical protein